MSTLNVANITDGTTSVGTGYVVNGSAKAWVNFNGTGTIAARDSFNVASLADDGTGVYSINFSTSMGNANYSTAGSAGGDSSAHIFTKKGAGTHTASTVQIIITENASSATATDDSIVDTQVHGDLA